MTKETKIVAGLLAGAALGAAVALLLASDKGDDVKEKVSDWLCDLIDSSKDKLSGVTEKVKDTLSKVHV
jgi:gas vesicle protein